MKTYYRQCNMILLKLFFFFGGGGGVQVWFFLIDLLRTGVGRSDTMKGECYSASPALKYFKYTLK